MKPTVQYTREELSSLYDSIDDMSIREKRDLASELGCGAKAKELQQHILELMRDIRKKSIIYGEQDITAFWRLCNYLERYEKLEPFLKQEPIGFVKYLKDMKWAYIVSKKYDRYLSGGGSPSVKSQLNMHKNLVRFIEENSDDYKVKMEMIEHITRIITAQMSDYREEFLKRVEDQARKMYLRVQQELPGIEEKRKQAIEAGDRHLKAGYESSWVYRHAYIIRANKTLEAFVEKEVTGADKQFDESIKGVAARVQQKNLDIDNIKINKVDSDPKFFELLITDGKRKLYARSIVAAEFSDKMIAHFRFIITER